MTGRVRHAKRFLLAACVAVAGLVATVAWASAKSSASLPLKLVANVPLPGPTNRFDYTSFDPTTSRLYLAHMDAGELLTFDVRHRRVIETTPAPGVHGVISVPTIHRVYATATDHHALLTIDSRSSRVLKTAPAGEYPDGLAYDPTNRKVFVSDESGGVDSVFSAAGRRIGTVALGGEAGNTKYDDGSRRIIIAVQTRNQLAVINPRSNKVVQRANLPGCDHPHGLQVDSPRRLLFVACDGNARLLTLDLRNHMQRIGSTTVGEGPDVLAFDPKRQLLYVAAESGDVAMFAEHGRRLVKLGQAKVADNAHTVAVDPHTHLVYFPLEQGSDDRPELRIMAPTR